MLNNEMGRSNDHSKKTVMVIILKEYVYSYFIHKNKIVFTGPQQLHGANQLWSFFRCPNLVYFYIILISLLAFMKFSLLRSVFSKIGNPKLSSIFDLREKSPQEICDLFFTE